MRRAAIISILILTSFEAQSKSTGAFWDYVKESPLVVWVVEKTTELAKTLNRMTNPPAGDDCHDCRFDQSPVKPVIISLKPYTDKKDTEKHFFSIKCKNFIQDNGTYGPWGTDIKNYLEKNQKIKTAFFDPDLLGMDTPPKTCPRWKQLSHDEKLKFWVWTFAAIAQDESTCDPEAVNTTDPPR